jgi:6-phosphogluconolactonase
LRMDNKLSNDSQLVFVGTYTREEGGGDRSSGIYAYRMDPQNGALTMVNQAGGLTNPSFLAVDPSRRYLLAVSEMNEHNGRPGGAVGTYVIDPSNGGLSLINSQSTYGGGPCYVSIAPGGHWVLAANFVGGSLTVLPLGADGRLGPASGFIQHPTLTAENGHPVSPHAHSILQAPGSQTLIVAADLGLDRIYLYDLDPVRGVLAPHRIPWLTSRPGAGPRHLVFHPNQRYLYGINENDSTVSAFQYDAAGGSFTAIETLSLLPVGYDRPDNTGADIHIHPAGKFLYASNRGHDSLAIFAVDAESGRLTPVGHCPTQGKSPRNFAIAPDGSFILAANYRSDTIVSFHIDPTSGQLEPTGAVTHVPAPVCVKFYTGG